jgi:hypothetical protein
VTNVTLHIDAASWCATAATTASSKTCAPSRWSCSKRFAKQQDKIAHLQKFIARFKAKASKAKQAQSRVKALDRMEKIAPLLAEADFTFEFKEPANLPNPMLSMQRRQLWLPAAEDAPGRHAAHHHRAQRQPLGAGRPAHRHPGRQRPGQVHAGQDHGPRPGRSAARSPKARA